MAPARWVLGCGALFVGLCNAQGTFDWAVQAGGSGGSAGNAIAPDGLGGSVVTGTFCQGQITCTATFGNTNLTVNGGYGGRQAIFVMHVTSAGIIDSVVRAGGTSSEDFAYGIAPDASGGYGITGAFMGMATFGTTNLTSTNFPNSGSSAACDGNQMACTAAFVFNLVPPVVPVNADSSTLNAPNTTGSVPELSGPSPTTVAPAVVQIEAGGSVRIRAGGTLEIGAVAAA